ncbi:FBD-associated F-box protein At5g56370-like isoform X1 [Fagus crenata]
MASSAKSTSKRQIPSDPEEATVVDRISNLPDSLLSHILSFLTIKESVTTSILSSRWKPLWTLVPNLVLDDSEFKSIPLSSYEKQSRNRYRFAHIVARVCALRNANPLKKFRLHWYIECDPIHADTWVRAAIARDLEELDLHLHLCPPHLFDFSYYVKSLVVLKLSGNIVINPPSSSSLGFPRLKNLHLQFVDYANHDSFSTLLNCCPVLQDLSIKIFRKWENYNFEISVPTLKRLDIRVLYQLYKLVINAPALEYLSFSGFLEEDVLLGNLSNLVEAVLDVDFEIDDNFEDYDNFENRVWDFISALYSVKSLHLHAETTKCLSKDSKFDLPMFHNLALLNFCFESSMCHVLPLFLERAPNLEVLILDKNLDLDTSSECILYEDVPKCVSSHLTAFHFKGFQGFNAELEFVEQILKWARVLKKMTISSYPLDSEKMVCVLKELLMFPRQSATCKIEFN